MSRKSLVALVVAGFLTDSALAGSTATVTPIGGSIGQPFNNGTMHGYSYNFAKGGPAAGDFPPRNLYDNIPTFLGGTGTPGFFGPFGSIGGTYVFVDWVAPDAQWGDDLHRISDAGQPGGPVMTKLWYGYFNHGEPFGIPMVTHIIKLYDMVPPSVVPPVTALITKGALVASIVIPNLPTSTTSGFTVQVPVPPIPLGISALWWKFEETGFQAPYTFWLTGGVPGRGISAPGVTYTIKNYSPDGSAYNLWMPFPYFYFGTLGYVASNITVGIGGIPGPAVISLLGLGGLVALRRRRR